LKGRVGERAKTGGETLPPNASQSRADSSRNLPDETKNNNGEKGTTRVKGIEGGCVGEGGDKKGKNNPTNHIKQGKNTPIPKKKKPPD